MYIHFLWDTDFSNENAQAFYSIALASVLNCVDLKINYMCMDIAISGWIVWWLYMVWVWMVTQWGVNHPYGNKKSNNQCCGTIINGLRQKSHARALDLYLKLLPICFATIIFASLLCPSIRLFWRCKHYITLSHLSDALLCALHSISTNMPFEILEFFKKIGISSGI